MTTYLVTSRLFRCKYKIKRCEPVKRVNRSKGGSCLCVKVRSGLINDASTSSLITLARSE